MKEGWLDSMYLQIARTFRMAAGSNPRSGPFISEICVRYYLLNLCYKAITIHVRGVIVLYS